MLFTLVLVQHYYHDYYGSAVFRQGRRSLLTRKRFQFGYEHALENNFWQSSKRPEFSPSSRRYNRRCSIFIADSSVFFWLISTQTQGAAKTRKDFNFGAAFNQTEFLRYDAVLPARRRSSSSELRRRWPLGESKTAGGREMVLRYRSILPSGAAPGVLTLSDAAVFPAEAPGM